MHILYGFLPEDRRFPDSNVHRYGAAVAQGILCRSSWRTGALCTALFCKHRRGKVDDARDGDGRSSFAQSPASRTISGIVNREKRVDTAVTCEA